MDDLSDLPPLQAYHKKRVPKQDPLPKILLPSPEKKLEPLKPYPQSALNSLDKSLSLSPNNQPHTNIHPHPNPQTQSISKHIPTSASSMLRQTPLRVQTRKNRIQRTSKNDKQQKLVEELDDKELLRGRRMITNMINKTGTKNMITEAQTSIQTINKNIEELNKQIEGMEQKIYQLDYMISNDPNNMELDERRKELIRFVQKLETTNKLYKEQIDMRTENKSLMQKIQKLKQENMQIKGRVIEGLQKIEGHMHNLPCEREKSALIELEKVRRELERERKMREDLENRVQGTIQDFSRLYEEADLARKIIVGKLKKLEITEEQMEWEIVGTNMGVPLTQKGQGLSYHHSYSHSPPQSSPPPFNITNEDRALQSPPQSVMNGSRIDGSKQGKEFRNGNMNESLGKKKKEEDRDSRVRNKGLAEKVGMMRGNMQTFKKMKF